MSKNKLIPNPKQPKRTPQLFSPVVEKSLIYLCGNFPITVIISACSWPWEHFQRNQYSGKPFVIQKGCYSKAINIKTLKLSNFRNRKMEEGNVRVCVCVQDGIPQSGVMEEAEGGDKSTWASMGWVQLPRRFGMVRPPTFGMQGLWGQLGAAVTLEGSARQGEVWGPGQQESQEWQ